MRLELFASRILDGNECATLIGSATQSGFQRAKVAIPGIGKFALGSKRRALIAVPQTELSLRMRQRISEMISRGEAECSVDRLTEVQVLKYEIGSRHPRHRDTVVAAVGAASGGKALNILRPSHTVVVQLSPPSDYSGGELIITDRGVRSIANHEQGSATVFPSRCVHEVLPITGGVRFSAVCWCAH